MLKHFVLGLLAFFSMAAAASGLENPADGLCQFSKGPGGLSQAFCKLPNCPTGGDCVPPTIQTSASDIQYMEPLLQWKDACPSSAVSGGCWEVYMDFVMKMSVSDPSGLSEIGVNIAQDLDGKRTVKKYASPAVKAGPDGRFEINGGLVVHVPGGRPLELSVVELCAKDNAGNSGCIPAR